jgi:hypothetical protein
MEILQTAAGMSAAITLSGAAAIHLMWARGSTWPAETSDDLANLVGGKTPMPSSAACAAVAVALTGAAGVTALASSGHRSRLAKHSASLAAAASGALLLRGVGGLAIGAAGVGDVSPEFRRWDRRLYSPLCVALGALIAFGRRRAH